MHMASSKFENSAQAGSAGENLKVVWAKFSTLS